MKLLVLCLVALVGTSTGAILCDGTAQSFFQVAFFVALVGSVLVLLTGAGK
jgi:hypothetical protein